MQPWQIVVEREMTLANVLALVYPAAVTPPTAASAPAPAAATVAMSSASPGGADQFPSFIVVMGDFASGYAAKGVELGLLLRPEDAAAFGFSMVFEQRLGACGALPLRLR